MFEPIEIQWLDKAYKVPANKVLGLIATIERHVNIVALSNVETLSYVALACGYASAIRYAGGSVTDEEVYEGLFMHDKASSVREVIGALMMLMVPPSARVKTTTVEPDAKKKTTRQKAV